MKLECELKNITYDFTQKGTKIEFFVYGDEVANLEKYLGKKVNVELKNDKRSKSANSYLWALIGELQNKLRIPKEDIYRQYIYACGVYDLYCMKHEALESFVKYWTSLGLGWVVDTTTSKLPGCVNVLAYKGTSEYSKEEMGVLLDQVVQDCIDQGIPTKRKEEIESLLEEEYRNDKN